MNREDNIASADRASKAIETYDDNQNEPLEAKIIDLLTDLLHLADQYVAEGADHVLRIAKGHFDEETSE